MNIGIYLRLSVNNSIESQKKIIYDYLSSSDISFTSVTEYEDNGFSGTKSNRPQLIKLLDDCKNGSINCIIVKDFSRLARNYITSGTLIDSFFPAIGIRFISVTDNYDSFVSKPYSDNTVPIKNVAAALYSRDISAKIHYSKKLLSEKGVYLCSVCPFGYKKGNKKNTLEPHPENSRIVKNIFVKISENIQPVELSRIMNQNNPTHLWTPSAIRKIIRNNFYTGTFKNIKNHHIAIISEELFTTANKSLKSRNFYSYTPNTSRLLAKKVFCGNCGRMLYYKGSSIKYYCPSRTYANNSNCYNGTLCEKELADAVVNLLTPYVNKIIADNISPLLKKQINIVEKSIRRTDYLLAAGTKNPERQAVKLNSFRNKLHTLSALSLKLSISEICSLVTKIEIFNDRILIHI